LRLNKGKDIKYVMEKVTAERKKEIFKKFGGSENNTGSVEGQIALFTERIAHLTEHVKKNRKDFSNTKSLTRMVGQRRKLLKYLADRDIVKYRELIKELGLRR
jgi:small subunit ribosomal protein S15